MNIKSSSYTSRIGTHLVIRFRRDDQGPTAYLSEKPMCVNEGRHWARSATTLGVAYILCAILDALLPTFGLLAALAPASPWPL